MVAHHSLIATLAYFYKGAQLLSNSWFQHQATTHHLMETRVLLTHTKKTTAREQKLTKGARFLTHWFALYTETSEKEQSAVRYGRERMPRSAHRRGGNWNSVTDCAQRRQRQTYQQIILTFKC